MLRRRRSRRGSGRRGGRPRPDRRPSRWEPMAPMARNARHSQYDRSMSAPRAMQTSTWPDCTARTAWSTASRPLAEAPPRVWAKPRIGNCSVQNPHRSESMKPMPYVGRRNSGRSAWRACRRVNSRCCTLDPPMTRPMRDGSARSSPASCHASCRVVSAALAESDAVRRVRAVMLPGRTGSPISAPRKAAVSSAEPAGTCRPGRCMTPKAWRPSRSAAMKSSLPCPTAVVTPRPVTTTSRVSDRGLVMDEIRQLAYVLGIRQLDQGDAYRQRLPGS